MKYNYNDIKKAYKDVGVSAGMTISLKTDLRFLGPYKSEQYDLLEAHFNALSELIDLNKGTIVVSTASFSLCNSETVFDIENTPSEMGALTEYIRLKSESVRSFHPFTSYTAIGRQANYICNNNSRHSVGPNSPKERMLELDARYLSVGFKPSLVTMAVHHVEQMMGVPYRFVKEFNHPVLRKGRTMQELFYLFVRYPNCNIKNDLDRKVYPKFLKNGFKINKEILGRGNVYFYSMNEFCSSAIELLTDDLYACVDGEPLVRPYGI